MPLIDDDDTLAFGDEVFNTSSNKINFTHPYVTFFHLIFRGGAIISYILCGWFSDSFISSFVFVVILLCMDFWTVKNISGRLMVGLRWWNYIDDNGKSHWVFETRKSRINEKEAGIFWTSLILTSLLWCILFIIALFGLKLKWLLLVMIALALNNANLYGYIKCRIGSDESISSATIDFFRKQVLQNAVSLVSRQVPTSQTTPPANIQPQQNI